MESTIVTILIAILCAGAGFGVAYLWSRSRPAQDQKRTAELEAQLTAVR